MRFTVTGKSGQLAQVDLGVVRGSDGVIARAAGSDTVYLLAPTVADYLPVSLEALRSRFVEKPGDVKASAEPDAEPAGRPTLRPRGIDRRAVRRSDLAWRRPPKVACRTDRRRSTASRCAPLAGGSLAAQQREHRLVHAAVARDDVAARTRRRSAGAIAHASARLLDDQEARGDVPRVQLQLPVAVEAAARDVAEVERGAAVAAHGARVLHEAPEVVEVVVVAVVHVVGEAGREQRRGRARPPAETRDRRRPFGRRRRRAPR